MVLKTVLAGVLLVGTVAICSAANTGSSPGIVNPSHPSGSPTTNAVALLETTTTVLGGILTTLGISYDDFQGPPFPTTLSQYTDVFVGMDGGLMENTDVQNLAAYVQAGGRLHFYGGTSWQDYVTAMNMYLVQNDLNNYSWTENAVSPDVRVTDPNNSLAFGLPATYNFSNRAASYYQLRVTDPAVAVAADNGDGYHMLFGKFIGAGTFTMCINSPYVGYWAGQDLAWITRVVSNGYIGVGPVPTKIVTWGNLKAGFREGGKGR